MAYLHLDTHTIQDLDRQIEQLLECKRLPEPQLKELCNLAKEVLSEEPNVVSVHSPLTVCGAIHGQFHDLLEIFTICGKPPDTNYLFLGNYVNRGPNSLETYSLLICLKVRFRDRVMLLRGSHESKYRGEMYGMYDECFRKYGNSNAWKYISETFNFLPIAALVDGQIFCVHGGLSPSITCLDDIRQLDRMQEEQDRGAISDLLWSDPEENITGWKQVIGPGYIYGKEISGQFNRSNGLLFTARSHQLVMGGFIWRHDRNVLTVFSASDYCRRCGNYGAVLEVGERLECCFQRYLVKL